MHFFVHITDGNLSRESIKEKVKARATELWLTNPLQAARLRICLYQPDKGGKLPDNLELLDAVMSGLRTGGLITMDSFIWRTWIDYDFHKTLPYPILSIYVGWAF